MKRDPDVEDLRLWAVITSTVRPLKPPAPSRGGTDPSDLIRGVRVGESDASAKPKASLKPPVKPQPAAKKRPPHPPPKPPPADLEAGLHRRLARGREALAARIDLHGLTQDAARIALTGFVERAAADGWRAVLVITGKGVGGDGVLRRRVPDWLAEAPIRAHVAGVSEAHRRHGGEGALYVALKRVR